MDARHLQWQDLQTFLSTARCGTLSGAADVLGLNASTVQRRIGKLELDLGTRLFVRSPQGYALTAAGHELLKHAQVMDEQVLSAERRVGGHDRKLSGTVRVATVDDIAATVLGEVLADFSLKHPRVSLEVAIDPGLSDLTRRQADVAIRPGSRPTQGDLIADRICAIGVALYASEQFLADHPEARSVAHLRHQPLVRADVAHSELAMEQHLDQVAPRAPVALRSDSMLMRLHAVRAGMGVGLLPCFAADFEPSLLRLSPVIAPASAELWIVRHADLRRNARVRAFISHARQALTHLAPRFENGRA